MRDYGGRLDPDDNLGEAETLAALVRNPLVRQFLRFSKAKVTAADIDALVERMRTVVGSADRVASLLAPLGWCAHGSMPVDAYARAADLVEHGDPEGAEMLLERAWNEGDLLRTFTKRLITLYDPEDSRRHHRWAALDEALRCHEQGFYRGAICIVLTLIEGLTYDVAPGSDFRFYQRSEKAAAGLTDDDTVAGHPDSLFALSRLMGEKQDETAATGRLRRNGILHGRELDYGSRLNSTKAFVALIAAIEWAQPLARALIEERQRLMEDANAGSTAIDEYGRRVDRRGFDDAKKALMRVAQFEFGRRRNGHPYTASLHELDPHGPLATRDDITVVVMDDASEFWAWVPTRTGWVFGIAGRGGEYPSWLFSGDTPPRGGIGDDDRWRAPTDPGHPDW